jgi:hypothetical protein
VFSPGASLVLGASVARNGPRDHFVRLRRTAPNPLNYTRNRAGISMWFGTAQMSVGPVPISLNVHRIPARRPGANCRDLSITGSQIWFGRLCIAHRARRLFQSLVDIPCARPNPIMLNYFGSTL